MGKNTMISINLTPIEELEKSSLVSSRFRSSPYCSLVTSYMSVQFYLDEQENQVEELRQQIAEHEEGFSQIQGELSQFNDLNEKITALESKKNSLLQITDSKLIRYLPVILIENLQNLKPRGLWFSRVAFVDTGPPANNQQNAVNNGLNNQNQNNQNAPPPPPAVGPEPIQIVVEGSAFNKIIIAEFMTALKATQNQNFDARDVRTQLFFDGVDITYAESATIEREDAPGVDVSDFRLVLTFKERRPAQPAMGGGPKLKVERIPQFSVR